jgi:hypothetical protein
MSLSKKYLCVIVVSAVIGCTPKTPVANNSSPPPQPPAQPAAKTTPALSGSPMGLDLPGAPEGVIGGAPAQPAIPAVPAVNPQSTEQVKADTGVGLRGQSLQGETGVGGMMVEPAKAYFRVEQKMVFQVQIPEAMKLFQATEGRFPNSEAEFMSKIIEANSIKLPKLPPGQKYIYNVENAELMVERPKK